MAKASRRHQLILPLRAAGLSDRLWRLAACALARHVQHLDQSGAAERYILAAERGADLVVDESAMEALHHAYPGLLGPPANDETGRDAIRAGHACCYRHAPTACERANMWAGRALSRRNNLGNEFGINPYDHSPRALATLRTLVPCFTGLRSAWHAPSQVIALAGHLYDNRDWGLAPMLADLLDDADQPLMADHLRQGTHYRGRWVTDTILGLR